MCQTACVGAVGEDLNAGEDETTRRGKQCKSEAEKEEGEGKEDDDGEEKGAVG